MIDRTSIILDNVSDFIFLLEYTAPEHFVLIDINRAAARFFGIRREDFVGCALEDILPEPVRKTCLPRIMAAVEGRQQVLFEQKPGPTDARMLETCYTPIFGESGECQYVLSVSRDITRQKEAEREFSRNADLNRENEIRTQEAHRLEMMGRMAGGIAHDFNNLLTSINGYSELLLSKSPPDSPDRPFLEEINQAGIKAAYLTRQILAYGRKQVLLAKRMDLNAVIREMEEIIRRISGEGVRLELGLTQDKVEVRADPVQIRQVILNLVMNAKDAMSNGGVLILATAIVDIFREEGGPVPESVPAASSTREGLDSAVPAAGVAAPGFKPGLYAVLTVTDTGCGMSPEVKARAFEPFFTTKEMGEGSYAGRTGMGLGLAMVEGIVTQSGGFVSVKSQVGQGTTVAVHLPAWVGEMQSGPLAGPSLNPSENDLADHIP